MSTATATVRDSRPTSPSSPTSPASPARAWSWRSVPPVAFLTISALYFLLPLWWLVVSATKSNSSLQDSNGFWFHAPQLIENIHRTFTFGGGVYARWLLNSIVYSTAAALIGTMAALGAGYVLAKFDFAGKRILFGGILAGVLIPSALLTIPLYFVASWVGLINSPWAVIIPTAVSPFGVYLARIYAEQAVPDEILEAARVDGASELRVFFSITLRILSPAAVTIFLFIFVSAWNNFLLPLMMLNSESLKPVTLGLYGWQNYRGATSYDIVLTGSLIAVAVMAALFFVLQRQLRSGIAAGSVKG